MGREGEWQSRDQTGYNGDLEKKEPRKRSFWFSLTMQTVLPGMDLQYTDSIQDVLLFLSITVSVLFV